MAIEFTPENIENYPWIFDFLEQQRKNGQYYWKKGCKFTYEDNQFRFQEPVLARLRKNGQSYAYEMICKQKHLGAGVCGDVYEISATLSNGKQGKFQARNKQRVVKIQSDKQAIDEYQYARVASHLHAKKPTRGYAVMKKIPGQTLHHFVYHRSLNRHEKLALTKVLFIAFKEQLLKKNIFHNDLHAGNILVASSEKDGERCFNVNLIDYGLASFSKKNSQIHRKDLGDIQKIIRILWANHRYLPWAIHNILNLAGRNINPIEELEKQLIAPTESSQKALDNICAYLDLLSQTNSELATALKKTIIDALKKSSALDGQPLMNAFYCCYTELKKEKIEYLPVLKSVFHTNPQKQALFDEIIQCIEVIEKKGHHLAKSSRPQDGNQLIELSNALYEQTFIAANQPAACCQTKLSDCGKQCQNILAEHQDLLDIHRQEFRT